MSETLLSDIILFFERFSGWEDQQATSFHADFYRFKNLFTTVREQVLAEARLKAPAYNVFSLLGLSRLEVRTHSAMLAHLLDPLQSHGQQHFFLSRFIEYCASIHKDFPTPSEDIAEGLWIIRTEVVIPGGRMDIVVQSPDLNCLYVIENKIGATEQKNQLACYGQWMQKREERYDTQALIFLTIRGDEAKSAQGQPYYTLSYHQDIAYWLESMLEAVQAPNVREVVRQYLALVRNL